MSTPVYLVGMSEDTEDTDEVCWTEAKMLLRVGGKTVPFPLSVNGANPSVIEDWVRHLCFSYADEELIPASHFEEWALAALTNSRFVSDGFFAGLLMPDFVEDPKSVTCDMKDADDERVRLMAPLVPYHVLTKCHAEMTPASGSQKNFDEDARYYHSNPNITKFCGFGLSKRAFAYIHGEVMRRWLGDL